MSFISSVTVIFQLDPPNSSAFSNQKHHHQYHTISPNNNTTNGSPKVDCFLMITEIKLQHKTILAEHIITHENRNEKERVREGNAYRLGWLKDGCHPNGFLKKQRAGMHFLYQQHQTTDQ